MLHFRIHLKHDIKVFLVEYDSNWNVIANKVSQLFELPPDHVVLLHKDRDGTMIKLSNQDELRAYLLGPKSARAVAGLPLDFSLRDVFGDSDPQNWKYSIVTHIGASEAEDTDYERPDGIDDFVQGAQGGGGNSRFTDEDYTFVQPPALDPSDMVNLVVPGEGLYAVQRHTGIGSTPNIQLMEMKLQDTEDWDTIPAPTSDRGESESGQLSVDYPNVHLEEPFKEQSIASSGPPRIPSRDKGKGRAKHQASLDGIPLRLRQDSLDMASNRSVRNNSIPLKPSIYVPESHPMSPIPLISNIVKKMSLEHAKARTIGDNGSQGPETPTGEDKGYDTLVNQLVSLVDVVSNLLEDDGVKHQIRGVWDGFSTKSLKEHLSPTTPGGAGIRASTLGGTPIGKSREITLAEGLVNVMKRVATIVDEDEISDVEEQDGDVIWTHPSRTRGQADIRSPTEDTDSKPATPTTRTPKADKTGPPKADKTGPPPLATAKSSKQRLEEAKAVYKAEKARYRSERDQKRRDKLAAKGLMMPEPIEIRESDEEAVPVTSAPPGRRTSLMSAPDPQSRTRSRKETMEKVPRAGSSVKPSAGSTYSPALLPARLSHPATSSIIKAPLTASPTVAHNLREADEEAADAGSEGPGTPKAPPRPERASTQFDFDAFMEANAWAPKATPGWLHEQPTSPHHGHFPTSARPSIATGAHHSMNPPPRVYMQTGNVMDSPAIFESASIVPDNNSIPPTPPPRPRIFSPTHSATPPPTRGQSGLEATLAEAFRANPAPRTSLKRNRWGDGMGGRRMDVGQHAGPMREDSMTAVDALAHPPPVYSTDGEGGDDVLETGGPVRPPKGMLPLNEEFKRRCLTILHEYNATRDRYPNLDYLINQGIQAANASRQMVRLAAESNPQARETFLSEEVPSVVNQVLAAINRGSTPNYV